VTFKSNEVSSWIFSAIFHLALLGASFAFVFFQRKSVLSESIPFDVITAPTPVTGQPKMNPNVKPIAPVTPKAPPVPNSRAVFGLSKKSLSDENSNVAVKAGNTIAKAEDKLTLRSGDAEALPIPADEYMVTSMPKMSREIRAPYPLDAKSKRIQGIVTLELLIDQEGKVRQVKVLQGPGFGLNEAAAYAAAQFLFDPARVGEKTVAVMIRYNYKFVLE
jgi:protein TonB